MSIISEELATMPIGPSINNCKRRPCPNLLNKVFCQSLRCILNLLIKIFICLSVCLLLYLAIEPSYHTCKLWSMVALGQVSWQQDQPESLQDSSYTCPFSITHTNLNKWLRVLGQGYINRIGEIPRFACRALNSPTPLYKLKRRDGDSCF